MPVVGRGVALTTVLWHQGALPGALSAIAMLPDIDTSIVVLSNSLALNDCADWVLQLLIEEILCCPDPNDYIAHAKISASLTLDWFPDTAKALERERQNDKPPKPLPAYVGIYWNAQRCLKIVVALCNDKLSWALQGLEAEEYELEHTRAIPSFGLEIVIT